MISSSSTFRLFASTLRLYPPAASHVTGTSLSAYKMIPVMIFEAELPLTRCVIAVQT